VGILRNHTQAQGPKILGVSDRSWVCLFEPSAMGRLGRCVLCCLFDAHVFSSFFSFLLVQKLKNFLNGTLLPTDFDLPFGGLTPPESFPALENIHVGATWDFGDFIGVSFEDIEPRYFRAILKNSHLKWAGCVPDFKFKGPSTTYSPTPNWGVDRLDQTGPILNSEGKVSFVVFLMSFHFSGSRLCVLR
jgi:hypothetical protein